METFLDKIKFNQVKGRLKVELMIDENLRSKVSSCKIHKFNFNQT